MPFNKRSFFLATTALELALLLCYGRSELGLCNTPKQTAKTWVSSTLIVSDRIVTWKPLSLEMSMRLTASATRSVSVVLITLVQLPVY